MKTVIFFLFIVSPLISKGQKITVDEFDKFLHFRRVETSPVWLKQGLSNGIGVYFRSADSSYFITLKGYGEGADVIGSDDKLIFLLGNDSTITIKSTGIQDYEIGMGNSPNYYTHQYSIQLEEIREMQIHTIKSIRKYGGGGYTDIDLPQKNHAKVKPLAELFLNTLSKK